MFWKLWLKLIVIFWNFNRFQMNLAGNAVYMYNIYLMLFLNVFLHYKLFSCD